MVNGIHRFANTVGLTIHDAKTNILSAHVNPFICGTIILDGMLLEEVSPFMYLRSSLTATGQAVSQIVARINLTGATFTRLHNSLLSRR